MRWAEVIMVRSTAKSSKMLASTLCQLMSDMVKDAAHERIQIFHREKLDTDVCIVLFHKEKKTGTGGSPLGLRLAAALREFCLVHHTVWVGMDRSP